MDERWCRAEQIFHKAVSHQPRERAAVLAVECAGDADLRKEVESLLVAHEKAGDILDGDVRELAAVLVADTAGGAVGRVFGRYELLSFLGAGGMGEVYLGRDTRLKRHVAVKILPGSLAHDPERLRRFELEARAASAFSHPNVVAVFDIGNADGVPYIVTEFVDGHTLRERMNGQAIPVLETLRIALPVAEALSAAHRAGVVHRDVKPENILVRHDGLVKVLDFGLAKLKESAPQGTSVTGHGRVIGTPHYMSPEQARGEFIDSRSDIFSLGVVLYEMISGRKPFEGPTSNHIIVSLLERTPPALTQFGVHAALAAVIAKALAKDVALRYQSAADLETDLRNVSRKLESPSSGRPPATVAVKHPAIEVVGRDRELAALLEAYELAASGRSLMVCVTGEPGIGKTTVVDHFIRLIEEQDGGHCLIGRGRSSATLAGTEAYLPILEALDSLRSHDSGRTSDVLLTSVAPGWYSQLEPSASQEEAAVVEQTSGSALRLKRQFHALLCELSRTRTLVLYFDDLHWADTSTVDVLSFVSTRLERMKVLLVVTYRPSDLLLHRHPFREVQLELQARGVCRELRLDFLTRNDVADYIGRAFPNNRFSASLADAVHAKTEGNPLFMADLVRYLRERGVLGNQSGVWTLTRSLTEIGAELPQSILSMVERKLLLLEPADRRLLEAACVQGHRFGSAVVAEALEHSAEEIEERLRVLDIVHNVVRLTDEESPNLTQPSLQYRFVHALYHQALFQGLQPTRRVKLSKAVAEALLHLHGADPALSSRLARLFLDAREYGRAIEYAGKAAHRSMDLFAHAEAAASARLGLSALPFLPDGTEKLKAELDLQLTLGLALSVASSTDPELQVAMSRAREICLALGAVPQLAPALFALCGFYVVGGELPLATTLADQLLCIPEEARSPVLDLGVQFAKGSITSYGGQFAEARPYMERAIALHDARKTSLYRSLFGFDPGIYARADYGFVLWALGYPDQALQIARGAVDLAGAADPKTLAFTTTGLAIVYLFRREIEHAKSAAATAMETARKYDVGEIVLWAGLWHACADSETGNAEEALLRLRTVLQHTLAIRSRHSFHWFYAAEAQIIARTGRLDDALRKLQEAEACAAETGEHQYEAEIYRIRGEMLRRFVPDAFIEAEGNYQKALQVARSQGAKSLELRAAVSRCRMWRGQPDHASALETLARLYGTFTEGFQTPDLVDAALELQSANSTEQ